MDQFAKETLPISLEEEMRRSYLDYAMSVIVGRALPDVRDGLKPVHRRVLFAMNELGNHANKPHVKSARIVGDVIGKYHPHGDTAIYDTLVRLAQPWAMRHTLVSGQGNFGSQGNDKAAAMRYTECKMAPLAVEMVREIEQNTVDFRPNYDNREEEPVVLPARFPNLLVNGSTGIAVGMATNIPTHNLREVGAAVQWALEHPDATKEELLEAAMQHIHGPDFPGGGLIVGRQGIEDAYRTGRGSVVMRAVDVMLSLPSLLLAVSIATLAQRPSQWTVITAIAVVNIPIFARLLRGSMLAQRTSDHVLAARALGVKPHAIVFRHMLPNSLGPGELLMHYGTEEQKKRWIPGIADGSIACECPREAAEAVSLLANLWLLPLFRPLEPKERMLARAQCLAQMAAAVGLDLGNEVLQTTAQIWDVWNRAGW